MKKYKSSILFGIITTILWFIISGFYIQKCGNPLSKSNTQQLIDNIFSYPILDIFGRTYGGGLKEGGIYALKIFTLFIVSLSIIHYIFKLIKSNNQKK